MDHLRNIPQAFPRFLDLPVELQDLIWTHALPSRPRVLLAEQSRRERESACTKAAIAWDRPLALLSVCRGSRAVALVHLARRDQPAVRMTYEGHIGNPRNWCHYPLHVDLAADIVFIDESSEEYDEDAPPTLPPHIRLLAAQSGLMVAAAYGKSGWRYMGDVLERYVERGGRGMYYLCVGGQHVVHISRAQAAAAGLFGAGEDPVVLLPLPEPGLADEEVRRRVEALERYALVHEEARGGTGVSLVKVIARALEISGDIPSDLRFEVLGERAVEVGLESWMEYTGISEAHWEQRGLEGKYPYERMPKCVPVVMMRHCERKHARRTCEWS